jgi:hypothetical protein
VTRIGDICLVEWPPLEARSDLCGALVATAVKGDASRLSITHTQVERLTRFSALPLIESMTGRNSSVVLATGSKAIVRPHSLPLSYVSPTSSTSAT